MSIFYEIEFAKYILPYPSVGFPIVVTLYLLTSFQRSMDRFTAELSELVKELQRHIFVSAK